MKGITIKLVRGPFEILRGAVALLPSTVQRLDDAEEEFVRAEETNNEICDWALE